MRGWTKKMNDGVVLFCGLPFSLCKWRPFREEVSCVTYTLPILCWSSTLMLVVRFFFCICFQTHSWL